MIELFEKQDKEFEKWADTDVVDGGGNNPYENLYPDDVLEYISKIRKETLQAVREEVEKHKDHERTGCIEVLLKSLDIKECDHQWTEDSLLCMACGEIRVTITNS